jgi:hypothetical protein
MWCIVWQFVVATVAPQVVGRLAVADDVDVAEGALEAEAAALDDEGEVGHLVERNLVVVNRPQPRLGALVAPVLVFAIVGHVLVLVVVVLVVALDTFPAPAVGVEHVEVQHGRELLRHVARRDEPRLGVTGCRCRRDHASCPPENSQQQLWPRPWQRP